MKKTFLLLAALLVMGSSVFAGGGFTIGPKVGYQTAKLSYNKADIKAGFANHFTVGAFARIDFGGFYLQPEVLWFKTSNVIDLGVQSGSQFAGIDIPTGATMTRNAMDIQVPVLVGYRFDIVDIFAIRAQVGPTANFIIPQKTMLNLGNADMEVPQNEDFSTKSIAWGLQAGLGIDLFRFTLDINYNFGLSKIYGKEVIEQTPWAQYIDLNNIDKSKQNQFMVTLGFKIL
ncbi:MAG: PorT family protein [Bacteroidales bacterium]|nr:PorT family protein [Bacteroidales bacterium]